MGKPKFVNLIHNVATPTDERPDMGIQGLLERDRQAVSLNGKAVNVKLVPVSYTHLDVYKRQTVPAVIITAPVMIPPMIMDMVTSKPVSYTHLRHRTSRIHRCTCWRR